MFKMHKSWELRRLFFPQKYTPHTSVAAMIELVTTNQRCSYSEFGRNWVLRTSGTVSTFNQIAIYFKYFNSSIAYEYRKYKLFIIRISRDNNNHAKKKIFQDYPWRFPADGLGGGW